MATTEQFSLRWNNFHSNLTAGFHELLENSEMVDVTLAVEGHFFQAHKVVLSICSPYFKQMFKVNPCKHPIVILKDVAHDNMKDILEFMYMGQVNVLRENLATFLRTAELLQVKGLTGDDSSETSSRKDEKSESLPDDDQFTSLETDIELPPPHYSTPVSNAPKRSAKNTNGCSQKRAKTSIKNENEPVPIEETENVETVEDTKDNLKMFVENNFFNEGSGGDPDSSPTEAPKPYVYCAYCCRKFVNRYNLKVHIRDKHEASSSALDCSICGKVMRNKSCLRVHMYHHRKQQLETSPQPIDGTQVVVPIV